MRPGFLRHLCKLAVLSPMMVLQGACATHHSVKYLVISETYTEHGVSGVPQLRNAAKGATLVSEALERLSTADSIHTQAIRELTPGSWKSATDTLAASLASSKGDYAIVYIAAHGAVDSSGEIVLFDSTGHPFMANRALQRIRDNAEASVFFLDICRTESEALVMATSGVNLRGKNTVLLFSTDFNNTASDSLVFAEQTASEIQKRQELRITLRNIIEGVVRDSSRTADPKRVHHPWVYGLIDSDIYLAGPPRKPGTPP
jgi:Caspase domain